MTIIRANFINSENLVETVTPQDITEETYTNKYKGHLYCNQDGCSAQISFANRGNTPYFKTWKLSKHVEDCIYAFENDPSKNPTYYINRLVALPTVKKHEVLKRIVKKSKDKDKDRIGQEPANFNKVKHESVNPKKKRTGELRNVPTVDGDAPVLERDEKNPRMRYPFCGNIQAKDIGKYMGTFGSSIKAYIDQDSIRIELDAENTNRFILFFYRPFRESSQQYYDILLQMAADINNGTVFPFAALGMIESDTETAKNFV